MSQLKKVLPAGFLIGISGLLLSILPFGLGLEERIGLALYYKLRGTREAPPEVIIVTMDRASAERLKIPSDPDKWPHSLHASLTTRLSKKEASVIAFDMIFDEVRNTDDDALFAEALEKAQNVVLFERLRRETAHIPGKKGEAGFGYHKEELVPPIEPLASAALSLAPFPIPKVPVRVSQYWPFKSGAGDRPTLPVVVFQIFALELYDDLIRLLEQLNMPDVEKLPRDKEAIIKDKGVEELVGSLRDQFGSNPLLAEKILEVLQDTSTGGPEARKRQVLTSLIEMYRSPESRYLNFYGPSGTITTVPYYKVLQDEEKSAVISKKVDFKGKAVFVGLSERMRPEQKDGFHTVFSQPSGIDLSGVEIAATAFANILEDMHVEPLSYPGHIALMISWGMIMGLFCRFFPTIIAAGSAIGFGIIYLLGTQYQFDQNGMWYPLVIPLFFQLPLAFFGIVLWKYHETQSERQNIRRALQFYLPNRMVDELAKDIANIRKGNQIVYGVCLYVDAKDYTAVVETMEPEELEPFMEKYYEALFQPVEQHGGVVIDVAGDSMLAVWTTSQTDGVFKGKACSAALEIDKKVQQFIQSSGTIGLSIRIGLHSGYFFLGTVGAVDHYEYKAVGDIVNTTQRMESLNKYLGTRILASEEVLNQCHEFLTREVGKFRFKGKSKPILAHELMGRISESTDEQRGLCEAFSKALSAYGRQSWDDAIKMLKRSLVMYGKDGPSKYYLKRCLKHKNNPPGEEWGGVICLGKK